jgi:hypothetical protein
MKMHPWDNLDIDSAQHVMHMSRVKVVCGAYHLMEKIKDGFVRVV